MISRKSPDKADSAASVSSRPSQKTKLHTVVFILQITFVMLLLAGWLFSSPLRQSKSLWVLFFYSFPAEFLVAVVPHEPALLYFSKFHHPLTVALVAGSSTLLAEILNYSTFRYISGLKAFDRMYQHKWIKKLVSLFNRAPFLALWVAALTPIPFYPFRFLVVIARYPLSRYLLSNAAGRLPRFFLLAWFGHSIPIPDTWLAALFAVLLLFIYVPLLKKIIQKKSK